MHRANHLLSTRLRVASLVTVLALSGCSPSTRADRASKNRQAAVALFDAIRRGSLDSPLLIDGHPITYGAEVETGHPSEELKSRFDLQKIHMNGLTRFMGLSTEAWRECAQELSSETLHMVVIDSLHFQTLLREQIKRSTVVPSDYSNYEPTSFPALTRQKLIAIHRKVGASPPQDLPPVSTQEEVAEDYEQWLTHSEQAPWAYEEDGVLYGRPMAMLDTELVSDLALGIIGDVGLVDWDIVESCAPARDPNNWVPHPGVEKFLRRGSIFRSAVANTCANRMEMKSPTNTLPSSCEP